MGRTGAIGVTGFIVLLLGFGLAAEARSVLPPPAEPAGWVIEQADYTGTIQDRIARFEVRYTIRILRDGWTEIPLVLGGATVNDIKIEKRVGESYLIPRDGSYALGASRKGRYTVRIAFAALLQQDSQSEGIQLEIPRATFSTLELFVPRKDVELGAEDQLYIERKPDASRGGVTLTARVGAGTRMALRWRTRPAAPVKVEPVLYGEVQTLVAIEEQLAHLTTVIDYRIAQGETKELRIRVPIGVNLINVRGSGIEDWRVNEAGNDRTLVVSLGFPLKDTGYRLVIEGEQTIDAASASYALPAMQLTGVKQERGYLAVSRSGSLEVAPETTSGLTRIDVKELPDLFRDTAGSIILLAFKYHQHPYQATLTMTRHQDHPVLSAIAERGELATVISRQGELLTRAVYLIRTNRKQFLNVSLPSGAALWSCLVDGRSVKPVAPHSSVGAILSEPTAESHAASQRIQGEAEQLMIPLDTMPGTGETVSVELVYFERHPALTGIGQLPLRGPILDVPTTVADWFVYAPNSVKFLRIAGNLERGEAPGGFLDEPLMQVASAAETVSYGEGDSERQSFPEEAPALFRGMKRNRDRSLHAKVAAHRAEDTTNTVSIPEVKKEGFQEVMGRLARLQETGVLPLKIRLPKSGTLYRFNRLMTAQESLALDATFVHLPLPWFAAALGMILIPLGVVAVRRIRRA